MIAVADLADVVQERAEEHGVAVDDRGRQVGHQRIAGRIAYKLDGRTQGAGEVGVHRVAMVRIALRPASNLAPRGQESLQTTDPIQHVERCHARPAGAHDPEERIPGPFGPHHRVWDRGGLERVDQVGARDTGRLGHRREHLQCGVRIVDRDLLAGRDVAPETGRGRRDERTDGAPVLEHLSHEAVDG